MTKKRPIVPGELYYPIEIDPFSTPVAGDSKYPLALENVTSWVYSRGL